jgi:hypothetical protein
MIQQLVRRYMNANPGMSAQQAALTVLGADPLDLLLHMDQLWNVFNPWAPNNPPSPNGGARQALWNAGFFSGAPLTANASPWDHLGYSYVLENTRAVQILRRVVKAYRSGESLGTPSVGTQRWLDATEAILFGAANPMSMWLSTSTVRTDPEAVRRNAYWRLFGFDLAFSSDGPPVTFEKATAANTGFLAIFNELMFELWQAMSNLRNTSGANQADDDRIFRLTEQLQWMLRSRRQGQQLAREELAASTALGWVELTLSADTPVVVDLRAQGTSPADRLRLIGERVGLAPHSKSAQFFSMAFELSLLLRTIEAGWVRDSTWSGLLYQTQPLTPTVAVPNPPNPIGNESKRVITEWSAATGIDLKTRARPIQVTGTRTLVAVR